METDRTGFFEYDSMTNEERKSIIIEKIEGDIKEVKELLEKPISDKEAFKLIGKEDALEKLITQINSINENSVFLVDPSSPTIGTPQYLTTDNKFLNAAYWQVMMIRNNPRGFDGSPAASPEGETGKRETMSKIMVYIRALV
jgi:hypothetical protein